MIPAERPKLSLGTVERRAPSTPEERTRAWTVSPARAKQLKESARAMRRNPTEAQVLLWDLLKDKKTGFTFNREVVMGSAIVDFAAKTRWLVVEVGGTDGAEATIAALSDRKLADVGVRVLRFSEDQVLAETDQVMKAIRIELEKPFEKPRIAKA
jgi:very-short-patch-repair endonuclease